MSIRAMSWAYELTLGSPAQKAVLIALCDHADEQNSCYPSIARLVARTEFCEKTVRTAIQALGKAGLVMTVIQPGTSSRYHLAVGNNPGNSCTPVGDTAQSGSSYRTPRQEIPDTPVRATYKPSYNHHRTLNEPTTPRRKPASAAADEDFERFWKAYPRKVGKAHARKAWEKALPKAERGAMTIISAVNLTEWDRREDCRFVPHPATWLNREGWLDNVEEDA